MLYYLRCLPSREYARFRGFLNFTRQFGRELVESSEEKLDSKDIMSVLLRANAAEEEKLRLTDHEVIDQISYATRDCRRICSTSYLACSTLVLAGHDTTASSTAWWLYELSRHPDWQTRVREEVHLARRKLVEAGVT